MPDDVAVRSLDRLRDTVEVQDDDFLAALRELIARNSYVNPGSNPIVEDVPDAADRVDGFLRRSAAVGTFHGYLWERGRFQTLPTGSATGINNRGQITGPTSDPTSSDGFLLDRGRVTTFTVPGGQDTIPFGINEEGQIVGIAHSERHGGLRVPTGRTRAVYRDQPARRHRHRGVRHQQPGPDRRRRRQPRGPAQPASNRHRADGPDRLTAGLALTGPGASRSGCRLCRGWTWKCWSAA